MSNAMNQQNDLQNGWVIERLGDFVIYQKGKKPKNVSNVRNTKCSIPYVNIKAFEKNIIEEYTDGVGCVLCEDGDFIMVWDGARSGYVGKAIKGALGSTLVKINFPGIASDYAYYFLQSKYLQINTKSKGTGIPHVDPNLLWNYEFPIPPLLEQHRIVAKIEELFSRLDKGIESLKTAQQQLKTYRQAVLKWAFEGKLTRLKPDSSDFNNEQDAANNNQGADNLPKGWVKKTLGDITKKFSQKALPAEFPDAKFIGMDCIEPNTLKPFKFYNFKEFKSAGNAFKKNQVLYGRMRPYLNKVYKAEIDGVCSGEFIVLDCLNGFNPDLLKYILHHRDFVSFANHKTSGDRPRISFEEISDYPINVCQPEEQHQIVSEIEKRLSVADKLEEAIATALQQAEALRQSILKKAFEGKLLSEAELQACRNDPNWEPASVLLDRIRKEREAQKPAKPTKKSRPSKKS